LIRPPGWPQTNAKTLSLTFSNLALHTAPFLPAVLLPPMPENPFNHTGIVFDHKQPPDLIIPSVISSLAINFLFHASMASLTVRKPTGFSCYECLLSLLHRP